MTRRLAMLACLWLLQSCASPLTGLQCADDYTQCGGQCVDLLAEKDHCGSCDNRCPAGSDWSCMEGRCAQTLPDGEVSFDATVPDGSIEDGGEGGLDGGADAGDSSVGPTPVPKPDKPLCDEILPADECRCEVGDLKCVNVCVDPLTDVNHCGGCGIACMEDEVCAAGECRPECEGPLVRCGGLCIDPGSSFRHCGECNNECSTRVCLAGECAGTASGHIVVVGHSYFSTNSEQSKIPPGAVLLNNNFSPRILGYREHSDQVLVENINATLLDALGIQPSEIDEAVPDALSFQLASYDVLLIYPQTDVSQADLESKVMPSFEGVLASFLARGGVVLLFEGRADDNRGTYQIVTVDGLLPLTGKKRVTNEKVAKTPQGFRDFTSGLLAPYRAEATSFGFLGLDATDPSVLLYEDLAGLPVVIHRLYGVP